MKLHMIFEATEDGDAAWLVDAWDEYSIDGNPEGYDAAVKKARADSVSGLIQILHTTLDDEAVLSAFQPPALSNSGIEPVGDGV
jgi:hypothetical protein